MSNEKGNKTAASKAKKATAAKENKAVDETVEAIRKIKATILKAKDEADIINQMEEMKDIVDYSFSASTVFDETIIYICLVRYYE